MRKKSSPLLCFPLALALAAGSVAPAAAGPVVPPKVPEASSTVTLVQDYRPRWQRVRPGFEDRDRYFDRSNRNEARRDRFEAQRDRFERRGDVVYWRGHRGFRAPRPGYREYNGWWFPSAAFALGAIIGGAIAQPPAAAPRNAHVEWCYARYRSYRASDNTFQPYNGPRRPCISPYG